MTGLINWRQLIWLAVAICAVQAVYWGLIDRPLFSADRTQAPPLVSYSKAEVARLTSPTLRAAEGARYEQVELPWTYCCDTAVHAVRLSIPLDRVPQTGLGLISDLQVDNYMLAVNGSLIVAEGRMQPGNGSFHGQKMFLTRVPAGLLKAGDNVLTYIVLRDGFPYTDIYPPLIGEYEAMRVFSASRLWSTNEFHRYAAGLLGLLGLLAAIMVVRSEDWRFSAWLSALCAAFVGNYVYAIMLDPPFDGWGRMLAFFAVNMAVPVALLCFIDAWTGRPIRRLQAAALFLYGLTMAYIGTQIYGAPMPGAFDRPAAIWTWFLGAFAVAALVRMLWHFARHEEKRIVESALLSVCVAAVMMDGASNLLPQLGFHEGNLNNAAPFLMLAMLAAFLARNFRLFQSQATLNATLRAQVAAREAELVDAHVREQGLIRQQAHDAERRRIMQDIHDGLGSQLMSMMLAARLGQAEPHRVAEGLQAVIDEMRLMIDSMDSVGESLEAALATFRARIQPRVVAAGFTFNWRQAALPTTIATAFGPREVLQIFRIMQEAVTNALKHSGGDEITVTVDVDEVGRLGICVADNGCGGAIAGTGRGLANMDRRAAAVRGEVELVSPSGGGTRVHLRVAPPTEPSRPDDLVKGMAQDMAQDMA
ncbi:MAG: ATP-binding protein [Sphingopyxis sp.]|uniref:sensor histidine kinase n=1 Tax=Sphingopyxis sp. TaxID=1908224 RepID=UPI002AB95540|nr:ATP-binding protein [Sphingopyxis sp.]MDZ3832329.1 ATP-binding protein [Sphingopyxis sp.]